MGKAAITAKEKLADTPTEELKVAEAVLVIDCLGLTVDEVTNIRKELRENDVKMKVAKNTYLKRAAKKAGVEGLEDASVGSTAVIYADNTDDITEPTRIVSKYEDDFNVVNIEGGMLEDKLTSREEIKEFASIPGCEDLLPTLISILQAPVHDFAYTAKAVAEFKDKD